jgi:hypothetical protein
MSFACQDDLDRAISDSAAHLGMSPSQLLANIAQDYISSKEGLRNLPIAAKAYKLFETMKVAAADGVISPTERETLTDEISEILMDVRTA